jgi:hypothetical protein
VHKVESLINDYIGREFVRAYLHAREPGRQEAAHG